MSDNNAKILAPHLTAKELLSAKGICSRLIDEYNQVSRVLPKTGVKLFEPNGSWLQNKQIETCLETRKDLIKVERVNRLSSLAVAEWLPDEKKAKVTKKSGVEWNNYGNDIHGNLYLIPEEALLLLELNCLELQYDGLPLSIQQAYELLLTSPNADCTLSEYRVFSQLARVGYRLQRFQYEKSINERLEEMTQPRKKVIIDPENGRWMGKICDVSLSMSSCTSEESEPIEIREEVKEIMNNIVDKIELEENELKFVDDVDDKKNGTRVKIKPRVEIVCEETVVDPVKLIVSPSNDLSGVLDNKMIKWSGARIQRNVKLLPKRIHKKVPSRSSTEPPKITATSQSSIHSKNGMPTVEKRKVEMISSRACKVSKQEIIELLDDDIEEIPRTMTRMEMLNCIPNIASKDCIIQTISRGYIPHSIKPQKSVYEYDRAGIQRIRESNKNADTLSGTTTSEHDNSNYHLPVMNSIVHYQHSSRPLISPLRQHNLSRYNQRERGPQYELKNHHYTPRTSHNAHRSYRGLNPNSYSQNYMMDSYQNHYVTNSWSSFQVNVFRSIAMVGSALRSSVMQNNMHFNQMMCSTQQYHRRPDLRRQNLHRNLSSHQLQRLPSNMKTVTWEESKTESTPLNNDNRYRASFVTMPAESWPELKKKWKESKIITIEDKDDKMDCSEVEVVQRNVQPLVNLKNVMNFSDIYDRLRIIKPAQSKTVRRKKGEYKISYKVYSNTQHYRKSDPGTPMFHLVITRRTNNFLQPIDLERLQQELDCANIIFAYVSDASMSFMQAGLVSLPNLTDK